MSKLGKAWRLDKSKTSAGRGFQKLVGMTGLAALILYTLLLTQEAPSRQSRDRFVPSSALESKLSALLK